MIWHCSNCSSWNANVNDHCIVCDKMTTHKGHTDDIELLDTYLVTILYYVQAEVKNRLANMAVMAINGFTTK